MELEIHVIHYLVISTIMMFCGIYGFFTRKNLLGPAHLGRAYVKCHEHQLCSIQPLLVSRSLRRSFFQFVRYRHSSSRNRCSHRHHYQCIPECQTDTD